MKFIKFSVKRRVAISMLYGLVFLLGFLAWQKLPLEYMPNLEFPQLTVLTAYKNASGREVENLVTKVVEEACSTVKGVKRIHSVSKEGISIITVEFLWGIDMDFASLNLREKIDLAKVKLPRESGEPRIEKFNPFALPALVLSLTGNRSPQDLLKIAKRPVAELLEKTEGVAVVSITGGLEREILVELEKSKLASREIPIIDVVDAISNANITYPAGTLEDKTFEYVVRVEGSFENTEDINDVVVKVDRDAALPGNVRKQKNRPQKNNASKAAYHAIFLSSLGIVKDTFKKRESYSRYDGKENISISILKQAEANIVDVADSVKAKLKDIEYKLPKGIGLEIVYDQSLFIKKGVREMIQAGLMGAVLAFIVLFVFLGSYRDALIISTAIPTSIFAALFLLHIKGMTLNTVSLAGLAVGIGLLVDGAIVVIENITRHKEKGKNPEDSSVEGASEVFGAVTSSIGTTVVVFLPLVFVLGIIGQVFADLSWAIIFLLAASLAVAFTLIPMLTGVIKTGQKKEYKWRQYLIGISLYVADFYNKLLHLSLKKPRQTIIYAFVVFIFSVGLLSFVPKSLFPNTDNGQFILKLVMPIGTKLDVTNTITKKIENILNTTDEILHKAVTVGSISDEGLQSLGENEAQVVVALKSKRKKCTDEIIQDIKKKLKDTDLIGGKVIYDTQGRGFAGMGTGGFPIVIEMKGHDINMLNQSSKEIVKEISKIKGIYNVNPSLKMNSPEIGIDVKRDRLAAYNLSVTDLAKTVLTAVNGHVASKFREEGKEIDIRVRLKEGDRKNQKALHSLLIPSPLKINIPLESVAEIKQKLGPSEIEHYDGQRTALVNAGLYKRSIDSVKQDINVVLEKLRNAYPDFSFDVTGEITRLKDSFSSLKMILILSILLVYMIMAAQFESFWQPFLILITIPLSLIGMAPALLLTGHQLSAMAGMGLVLLCGIVVNNGIVLLDFVNQKKGDGMKTKDALIEGCNVRMRPILMTASTTILGLMPLAFGIGKGTQMQAPMAIVVVSGLFVSTILTLLILPTLYVFVEEEVVRRIRK